MLTLACAVSMAADEMDEHELLAVQPVDTGWAIVGSHDGSEDPVADVSTAKEASAAGEGTFLRARQASVLELVRGCPPF